MTNRTTKYDAKKLESVTWLCRLGAINRELAEYLGVNESTLDRWIATKPAFKRAILEGRTIADARVGESLYQRAMGYSHPEEKVFCHQGKIVTHETTKHYPPETQAITYWLKNRRRDLWNDRNESVNVNVTVDLVEYAKEYARRIGAEPAKRFLEDHGYSGKLIDSTAEEVPDQQSEA